MKKVLFIDADKELHQALIDYLPKEHYRVVLAGDGIEGLSKCKNEEFDLVIMEYKLPKLDGIKVFHQVRELQSDRKSEPVPVIFASALVEEAKARTGKIERCEFLNKPFQKEELLQKIQLLMADKNKVQSVPKADNRIILNPGERLFSEGDEGSAVYYVVSGRLEACKKKGDGEAVVGQIVTGELIGEMAFTDHDRRVMTIRAVERTELISIPGDKIMSIVNGQPRWIKLMIESLSKRLRDTLKHVA